MKRLPLGIRIEVGFGVEIDSTGWPLNELHITTGLRRIIQKATTLFGGCTVTDTRGTWVDPSGKLFDERGKTLSVLVESLQPDIERRMQELIFCIKHELDQQAVAVTMSEVRTGII